MASDNETASTSKPEEPARDAPSPADSRSEEGEARSEDSPREDGEEKKDEHNTTSSKEPEPTIDAPPLPDEPIPGAAAPAAAAPHDDAPPLPNEAPPPQQQSDDGWSAEWDAANQRWYFYNRFTGVSQWDNPRVATNDAEASSSSAAASASAPLSEITSVAGGYNPAIHGSWDPSAPYAQAYAGAGDDGDEEATAAEVAAHDAEMAALDGGEGEYLQTAAFNRATGRPQAAGGEAATERFSDAARAQRQLGNYFNVDQAANAHDGRSLKAERRGKQPTKKELAQWKEKRKARKEEKRRAWLRD